MSYIYSQAEMCRFELKSIHVISIYVTPQLGKFKRKCVILN